MFCGQDTDKTLSLHLPLACCCTVHGPLWKVLMLLRAYNSLLTVPLASYLVSTLIRVHSSLITLPATILVSALLRAYSSYLLFALCHVLVCKLPRVYSRASFLGCYPCKRTQQPLTDTVFVVCRRWWTKTRTRSGSAPSVTLFETKSADWLPSALASSAPLRARASPGALRPPPLPLLAYPSCCSLLWRPQPLRHQT